MVTRTKEGANVNRAEELRLKAHMLGQEALHHPARCRVTGGCYLCLAERPGSQESSGKQVTLVLAGKASRVFATRRGAA